MIEGQELDITPMFRRVGLDTKGMQPIIQTPKMYPYKSEGDIRQNWSYFMTFGLSALKLLMQREESRPPNSLGIVGIGNGIEGIAAAKIFQESLRKLYVIDTKSEILTGALVNIRKNIDASRLEIIGKVGSFAEPLVEEGVKLDLIAGNVPNLPADEDQILSSGADLGTFMPRSLYERYSPPEEFVRWALGAQYAYLRSAREALNNGGSTLTLVGGRFPLPLVDPLFARARYSDVHEVMSGYKEQTEPQPDFHGYAQFEDAFDDVSFDFYPHEWAERQLRECNIGNPTRVHNSAKIKTVLQSQRTSAREALEGFRNGMRYGHSVHLLRGIR